MIVILIVGFHNPGSIADCLHALARLESATRFEVFIAENGGASAADALIATLTAPAGPCRDARRAELDIIAEHARRHARLDLLVGAGQARVAVHIAELDGNLGYAGGVNAWLRALLREPGWDATWILNPDTAPEPESLTELEAYVAATGKRMVGTCLVPDRGATTVQLRGLAWHHLRGATVGVDRCVPAQLTLPWEEVVARLDAPSGASMYVQRSLIDEIGVMDEDYFLYYEDLDWGLRAKALGEIGYAERAVVAHRGSSTIRTATSPRKRSPLAVYLEFRNRILLVRRHFPHWTTWTVLMQTLHVGKYLSRGAVTNTVAAMLGLHAGLRGEHGPPARYLRQHRV